MNDIERMELDRLIFQMVANAQVGPGEDYGRKAFALIQLQPKEYRNSLAASTHRLSIALCLKAYNITRAEYDKIKAQYFTISNWVADSAVVNSYEVFNKVIEIYKLGYEQHRSDSL